MVTPIYLHDNATAPRENVRASTRQPTSRPRQASAATSPSGGPAPLAVRA